MITTFDCAIIGAGVAGSFVAMKLAQEHKNVKTILFDLGRPPMKRRRQLEGWLGCLPNSDGKLYLNDISNVAKLVGARNAKSASTYFTKIMSNIETLKLIKDKLPSVSTQKRLKKHGYDLSLNNHYQIYPKEIHSLSKYMNGIIEQNRNITYSFDNEIRSIYKQRSVFVINSDEGEFRAKKIILAVGRSGWRWATELYEKFGIIENNNIANFGIKVEMNGNLLKDFNKSVCSLSKDNIKIGPFNWNGSVVPEDHLDMAISAFRSNENRWKTDKVFFNMIGSIECPNKGFEQTNRLGKLTFVLTNDRIIKERVSTILSGKSKISIIPEYDWLKKSISDFSNIIPEMLTKAYFHIPTIIPMAPKINIGSNLMSDIDGMFVVGESAGVSGILAAATMGILAANEVVK
jgi:uncharacterized FAD-dependent dehydrogenase